MSPTNIRDETPQFDCQNCFYRKPGETFCGVCMQKILEEWQRERKKMKESFFQYVPYTDGLYVLDRERFVDGYPLKIAYINRYRKVYYFIYPIPDDIRGEVEEYAATREILYRGIPLFQTPAKRPGWEV